jgi:uncharacterized membrane protein
MKHGLPVKAKVLTVVVVLSNVLGNLALSFGMKASAVANTPTLIGHVKSVFSPMVLTGVTLLILWLLSRMTLMGWADLTYVLPVTSIGYVLSTLAGKFFLAEQISGKRWAGTLLIFAGALVVSFTSPRSRTSA